jgi:hypothetical protein
MAARKERSKECPAVKKADENKESNEWLRDKGNGGCREDGDSMN